VDFVVVGRVADFPEGEARKVSVNGRDLALFRHEGELHALDNQCLHRGGPLCEGFIVRGVVTCPWHGWSYEIRSGKMIQDPRVGVSHHEIRIAGDQVAVRLTD
jgi:nitrite reductase/ring-hydroxylating ferredoxin subunit